MESYRNIPNYEGSKVLEKKKIEARKLTGSKVGTVQLVNDMVAMLGLSDDSP